MIEKDVERGDQPPPEIRFVGLAGDFFLLQLVNVLLTIVTLGVYRFWAKTRCRRELWRTTLVDGDALEYRGNGLEKLTGAVLVVLLVSVPFGLVSVVLPALIGRESAALFLTQFVLLLGIYYLVGVGLYRSWRYILSRTSWRGLRGGMTEQGWAFGVYHFGLLMAQMFSLGFLTPWVGARRWNRLTRDMRIGSLPLHAEARSRPIYGRFLLVWAGVIGLILLFVGLVAATIGLSSLQPDATPDGQLKTVLLLVLLLYGGLFFVGFFGALLFAHYHAAFLRMTYGSTTLGDTMRLRFEVTTGQVIRFYLVNMALVLFTAGIGLLLMPHRNWAFHARRLRIDGRFDEAAMRQTDLAQPGQGDGLADAFDLAPF